MGQKSTKLVAILMFQLRTDLLMIPIRTLFETHLTVCDLDRAMNFYGGVLALDLAGAFPERHVVFYWIGGSGNQMLGLWEVGTGPQRMSLHTAFRVDLDDLLLAPTQLRAAGVTPLDFFNCPTDEPAVLAWMPAATIYFHDPDGNLLEFLSMLSENPRPEFGILSWTEWNRRLHAT